MLALGQDVEGRQAGEGRAGEVPMGRREVELGEIHFSVCTDFYFLFSFSLCWLRGLPAFVYGEGGCGNQPSSGLFWVFPIAAFLISFSFWWLTVRSLGACQVRGSANGTVQIVSICSMQVSARGPGSFREQIGNYDTSVQQVGNLDILSHI